MPFDVLARQLLVGQLHRRAPSEGARAAVALREALQTFEKMGHPVMGRTGAGGTRQGGRRATADNGADPVRAAGRRTGRHGNHQRDVAAALFISPKTLEANLSRVYHKLGIRSRAELARHIGEPEGRGT